MPTLKAQIRRILNQMSLYFSRREHGDESATLRDISEHFHCSFFMQEAGVALSKVFLLHRVREPAAAKTGFIA